MTVRDLVCISTILCFWLANQTVASGQIIGKQGKIGSYWVQIKGKNATPFEKIERMTGFLEGKFGVSIPDWWSNRLLLLSNGRGSGGPSGTSSDDVWQRSTRDFHIKEKDDSLLLKSNSDRFAFEVGTLFGSRKKGLSIDCFPLSDGGAIIAGYLSADSVLIVRVDSNSELQWSNRIDVSDKKTGGRTGVPRPPCLEIVGSEESAIVVGAAIGVSFVFQPDLMSGTVICEEILDQL